MGTKTTVASIAVAGGSLYDQPNNILVDERTAPFAKGRSRGSLYVLLELSGAGTEHDAISKQMLQEMRRTYYSQRGSVTAGLREAVYQANEMLLQENRNSLPGEQRVAGVSCAVLRGDDLFVAQAGPALMYVLHEGQESRYPDRSPWLDGFPPEEVDAVALGTRREINVDLFHSQIGPGDTIFLGSSGLARDIAPAAWSRMLSQTPVSSLLEDLRRQGGGFELSALVVRLAEAGAHKAAAQPVVQAGTDKSPRSEAAPAVRQPIPGAAVAARSRRPIPAESGRQAEAQMPDQREGIPLPSRARAETLEEPYLDEEPEDSESLWERIAGTAAQIRLGDRFRALLGAITAALAGLWYALLSLVQRMMPERLAAPQAPLEATSTASKAPARRKEAAKAGTRSESVQKLLLGVAIAIPLIVAVVVLVAWLQRGQARRAEQEALWQQANTYWEQAQVDTDAQLARTHLANAQRFVDEFLVYQPEHAEALDLRTRIQSRLDVVNQVRRISWVGKLNTYPADANLTRVVVQGAHVFVMDRHNGQVYHHRMDDQLQNALDPATTGTILVSRGDQVGNVVVGDLVDMVWMPTGPDRQKASLIILESGGAILDYDPATTQLIPLEVAASETWRYPKLVGSHSGRFYLLDSSANKIWRYDPTPDGYNSPPFEWLQTEVDLAGVVGLAIGDSIYLLYADGAIRKFSTGEADTFDISDWDAPPSNPTSIFTRPPAETRWIYVADRGNNRIVQASKEGQFKQQFRVADATASESGDPLGGATDLFVDEIAGQAYLLSGRDLYLLRLPMSE
jgi:hypothetical protein